MAASRRPLAALAAVALVALGASGCAAPSRPSPGDAGGASAGARALPPGDGRPPGGPEAAVRLAFGWPPDLQARVTVDHREWRGSEAGRARYAHRMVVAPEGRGLRVSVRDAEAEGNTPGLELNVALNETLDQIVGRDGTYLRTDGLERAVDILGADDEESRASSRLALERIAALDWELIVGAWAGRSLIPGQPVSYQFPAAVPLLPGVPALLDVEVALAGPAPCEEGEGAARCVELTWRASPGPRARAAAVERVQGARGEGAPPLAVEGLQASMEARLVAEPDTLLPHRLLVREELRLGVRQPGGDVEEMVDRSEDRYRFARETEL